jgi:hypothetical protein
MMRSQWVQTAVGTVVLTVLQSLLSFLVPAPAEPVPIGLAPVLVSNALHASLLVWIAARLRAQGLRRALVLWLFWGGIQVGYLVEAVLFDIRLPPRDALWLIAYSLAFSGCFALFVALAFPALPADRGGPAAEGRLAWWRLAASALAYVVLYFTFGHLAYPYLREFYEARPMPSTESVVAVQVVRGLWLSGIVLLLVRQLRTSPRSAAVVSALALSVLGGIAPLLIPNPYLPDAIRYAHLPEVGVSNFLFGLLAGWLLTARAEPLEEPVPSSRWVSRTD